MKGPSAQTRRGRALGPPVRPPSALTMDAGLVRHGSAFGSLVPSDRSAWSWPGSTRLAWTQSSGGCGGSTQLHSASRAVPQDPPPARPAPGGRGRQRRALVPRVRAAARRGSNGRVLRRYPLGDTEGTWRCPVPEGCVGER